MGDTVKSKYEPVCQKKAQELENIQTACKALLKDIPSLSELTIKANKMGTKKDSEGKIQKVKNEISKLMESIFKNSQLINNPKQEPSPYIGLEKSDYSTDYVLNKKNISTILKSLKQIEELAKSRRNEAKKLAIEEKDITDILSRIGTLELMYTNVCDQSQNLFKEIKSKIKIL